MFKEYRIEIAAVMGVLGCIMLYQGNALGYVGLFAATINYVCYKKGI